MINPKKRKFKKMIIGIVIVVILAVLGFTIAFLVMGRGTTKKELEASDIITTAKQEGRNLQEEISSLNTKYEDAKIWLKIPGTNIDTSVFQGADNNRYLRNDRENKETKWGENFLDYRCNINQITESMQHIIIYGHNTESDTRFSALLNYKKKEYEKKRNIIELSTPEGNYQFEIFSTYQTDTSFYYIETKFDDIEKYGEYVQSLKNKSAYETGVEVTKNDTILTLSTCDYSITDGRYVVHAKLIKSK